MSHFIHTHHLIKEPDTEVEENLETSKIHFMGNLKYLVNQILVDSKALLLKTSIRRFREENTLEEIIKFSSKLSERFDLRFASDKSFIHKELKTK